METEKYRFENGSLFKYNEDSHSYIHCFKQANKRTMKSAIKDYELQCEQDECDS